MSIDRFGIDGGNRTIGKCSLKKLPTIQGINFWSRTILTGVSSNIGGSNTHGTGDSDIIIDETKLPNVVMRMQDDMDGWVASDYCVNSRNQFQ